MKSPIRISVAAENFFCCPICKSKIYSDNELFKCTNNNCAVFFPILDGIPILINEKRSVFSIENIIKARSSFNSDFRENQIKRVFRRFTPTISKNIKAISNFQSIEKLLCMQSTAPRVLVIGGSILGQGMEALIDNAAIDFVESDVVFGPRTNLICDAHDIPFDDQSFDGVIVQAVLEYLVDPFRCCDEIHRVLKDNGVVYAETPFMQQVHGGRYDFLRFSHLGHRRLFRRFEEIDSGAVCGPGMALAWSYQYFLLSFATSQWIRTILKVFAALTSFYLKYFDYYLLNKSGALDAASAYYFIGRKTDSVLSDHDLIAHYRGNVL